MNGLEISTEHLEKVSDFGHKIGISKNVKGNCNNDSQESRHTGSCRFSLPFPCLSFLHFFSLVVLFLCFSFFSSSLLPSLPQFLCYPNFYLILYLLLPPKPVKISYTGHCV